MSPMPQLAHKSGTPLRKWRFAAVASIFALSLPGTVPVAAPATLFQQDDVLRISLRGALGNVRRGNSIDTYQPFDLSVSGVNVPVQVRPRGKSRRRVCNFPPLRLAFDPEGSNDTPFAGQTRLKLVTHCNGRKASEVNVLEEYLAYRIFNLISETSYKVRLARINYIDSDAGAKSVERYGFFIEPAHTLATRARGQLSRVRELSLSQLDLRQAARVFVFQYLIGNTDWSLVTADTDESCCHNVDLFKLESGLHPVPYDFDLAGLVNAKYAKPDPSLSIGRVTTRLYRGYCIDSEKLAAALAEIRSVKAGVMDLVGELPGLSHKDAARATRYLAGFFEKADNDDELLKSFSRRCI